MVCHGLDTNNNQAALKRREQEQRVLPLQNTIRDNKRTRVMATNNSSLAAAACPATLTLGALASLLPLKCKQPPRAWTLSECAGEKVVVVGCKCLLPLSLHIFTMKQKTLSDSSVSNRDQMVMYFVFPYIQSEAWNIGSILSQQQRPHVISIEL